MRGPFERDEVDAELLAEVQRARANDSRRAGRATRYGGAPIPVKDVPCCQCAAPVPISQFVVEMQGYCNTVLLARGEAPLADDELTRCPLCAEAWQRTMAAAAEKRNASLARLVREVKDGRDLKPAELSWLRANGYTDTATGLELLMAERRNRSGAARRAEDARRAERERQEQLPLAHPEETWNTHPSG